MPFSAGVFLPHWRYPLDDRSARLSRANRCTGNKTKQGGGVPHSRLDGSDHFAKTGSGQTEGKTPKKDLVSGSSRFLALMSARAWRCPQQRIRAPSAARCRCSSHSQIASRHRSTRGRIGGSVATRGHRCRAVSLAMRRRSRRRRCALRRSAGTGHRGQSSSSNACHIPGSSTIQCSGVCSGSLDITNTAVTDISLMKLNVRCDILRGTSIGVPPPPPPRRHSGGRGLHFSALSQQLHQNGHVFY
jgi:hypothetical protein